MTSYELNIVSHHRDFCGKTLKKYNINGIDTIGAYGDEPFELRFKNNTYSKVQVKLSLDGTDVFSGKVADTNTTDKMWVVNGHDILSLKAWPETNHGGASFVFTNVNNSVAANTHGNLSSKGIIAAAVFTESYVAPIVYSYNPWAYCSWCGYSHYLGACCRTVNPNGITWGGITIPGITYTSGTVYNNGGNALGNLTSYNSMSFNSADGGTFSCDVPAASGHQSKELQSTAAVGAGQHVDQHISYVSGLVKPTFAESIRVRYLWWDQLQASLRQHNVPAPHASGFPGDDTRGHINLGGVPRVGQQHGCFRRVDAVEYSRV